MVQRRKLSQSDLYSLHGTSYVWRYVQGNRVASDIFDSNLGTSGVIVGRNPPMGKLPEGFKGTRESWGTAAKFWDLSAKRGHGLMFASTGTGKNTNLIIPALLSYAGSAVVLDVKAQNAWITGPRRRAMGQRVIKLDPYGELNARYASKVGVTETVDRFNPLAALDPRSDSFADDIALIVDGVLIPPAAADSHWILSAGELVGGITAAGIEAAPGITSFRDVRRLLTSSDDDLQAFIELVVKTRPDSIAARKLQRFAVNTKEVQSIRSTALTQTAIFDSARLLDCMDTGPDAFDLADLARRKASLFIILPPHMLETHGRWMRLMIQLAMQAIARVPQIPELPVMFMLDELGTINPGGGLKMIEQAYGLLGGLGVRVWGIFQSLSQLQHDYPNSWRTFIANAETIQLIGVNDPDSAEYFSRMLGSYTVRLQGNFQPRPAMLPSEIMQMEPNEVLSIWAGGRSWRLPTIPYFLDPGWEGKFRPDPNYPAPPSHGASGGVASSGTLANKVAGWWKSLNAPLPEAEPVPHFNMLDRAVPTGTPVQPEKDAPAGGFVRMDYTKG